MKNSLHHKLSVWLSALIIVAGVLAGGVSFVLAYGEAQEFQDDMLRKIATLVDADRIPSDGRRVSGALDNDPEASIIVRRIGPRPIQAAGSPKLPGTLAVGFSMLEMGGSQWRIFVRDLRSGGQIAVMQATQVRSEAALDAALRTLVPLLALIPLLVLTARWLVKVSLAPVLTLAGAMDAQAESQLSALPPVDAPEEIMPFIHSINRLLERVAMLVGQQRRFVADAAHELRSPLTALSLQAQNIHHASNPEDLRNRVATLQAGIERARKLTDQLLSLARTQASADTSEKINLSVLARELIAEFLPQAEARHIDLGLEESAAITIKGHPEHLRLVLRNGLENALKYTPAGGEVTLRIAEAGEEVVIEIIDSGPGITEPEQERVFDAFYRRPGSGEQGSGLGLAIAREAAQRMGGMLGLHNGPDGHGLIFSYRQKRAG